MCWAGLCQITVPPCPPSLLLVQQRKHRNALMSFLEGVGGACLCFQLCWGDAGWFCSHQSPLLPAGMCLEQGHGQGVCSAQSEWGRKAPGESYRCRAQGAASPSEGHTGSWMLLFWMDWQLPAPEPPGEGEVSFLVPFHPHCAQWHNFLWPGESTNSTLKCTLPPLKGT